MLAATIKEADDESELRQERNVVPRKHALESLQKRSSAASHLSLSSAPTLAPLQLGVVKSGGDASGTRRPHQRHFSSSKPVSDSTQWMHSPAAQAARALRLATKSQRPALNDSQRTHNRQLSYGLPVEPLPAVDISQAQLPFQRFYFDLPSSLEAFLSFRDRVSAAPEGAAVCFLLALLLWSQGKQEAAQHRSGAPRSQRRNAAADDDLPLHVINASRPKRAGAVEPLKSKTQSLRLPSFKRPFANGKRVNLRGSLTQTVADEPMDGQDTVVSGWSMMQRWQALLACIHPDQLLDSAQTGESHQEQVAFRSRCLCPMDIDQLVDSLDSCPHLARSFVLGTRPSDHFALPSRPPPATPSTDTRKTRFQSDASWSEGDTQHECLSHLAQGCGPYAVRMARHPFASGTANPLAADSPFALLMVHNAGLRYPRSVKLRRDVTGRWKLVHWQNLLCQVPLE